MREIKFRFWDTYEQKMEYNPRIYWDAVNIDDNFKNTQEHTPVMQYTGLKDKNGKEIYEGDVIKYSLFTTPNHPTRTDEVKFISGCFVPDIWRTTVDGCEIIGNIYENPEIIK